MDKILIYLGDSFTVAGMTDYEWLVEQNLIDKDKINYFDFIKYYFLYKKNNSVFSAALDIRKKNSWVHRLSNKLNAEYINMAMLGASWQLIFNQILYSILNIKNKEIIFIIGCTINERILTDKMSHLLSKDLSLTSFYDNIDIDERAIFLLDGYSYHIKNKINLNVNFLFKEGQMEIIEILFTKKIFNVYNLQAIMNIINVVKDYQFYFLPSWYETVESQFNELTTDKELLKTFIFNKIPQDQLNLKSPFTLKDFKSNPYTMHPSFHSQELISQHYYNFLKNKI